MRVYNCQQACLMTITIEGKEENWIFVYIKRTNRQKKTKMSMVGNSLVKKSKETIGKRQRERQRENMYIGKINDDISSLPNKCNASFITRYIIKQFL